jgi:signal transduction histidine kinase/DNA-binding response OmpR family regulator
MPLSRAASIKGKLTLVVMATTTVALLVAAAQFIINDVGDYRRRVVADLDILATIVGHNVTSQLQFDDIAMSQTEATQNLAALEAKPHLLGAAVYTRQGKLFAQYTAPGQSTNLVPRVAPAEGHRFLKNRIVLSQTILKDAAQVGTIYLDFDLIEVWWRVAKNCALVAAMLVISAVIAFFVTARLQRAISKPILDLAQVANVISEKRDYSVRAPKQTEDEIGFLIDCFNGMLGQMERHEKTLRDVNEQLAKSETRALAATEAKSQFLANMSHELRTPLNAIIGYSEMVQEELEDAAQTQFIPDLQKIHSAAKHQLSLINDILDLSKIEAGKMNLFLETFDIIRTVREVATTVQPLVAKNGNRLDIECPSGPLSMRADQTKVRQILYNLLSNATKFTEKGSIKLAVKAPETDGKQITFTISDTGIGMSREQLGRLFQAFSQAEASTTRKYGGTGLGLAISKKFCQLMGGELIASSELGKGSIFTVTLPLEVKEVPSDTRATPVAAAETSVRPVGAATSSILVIDDEPAARDLVQRALTKEGFHVHTAASGPEGLSLARQLKPAAITLDVMMPGMDGWAVLTVLKADPITADIPVIMVTIVDDKNLGFALGATDYLIKPIDWDRLVAVLQRLNHHRTGAQVLIIEDEADVREVLRRAAQREGWEVEEAENGRVGLERVSARVPAVILLDLMMPEMDGFAFIEELRRRPECLHVPVIVVTAKDLTAEDRRRLNGHVFQILQKGGYSTRELLDQLHKLLGSLANPTKGL